MTHHVYTIVVTYNAEHWLDECFGSLRERSLAAQTIVVDNGSTDATLTRLTQTYPEVTLLPQTLNLGFGAANNLGIRVALERGAGFVFLLNQDAWFAAGTMVDLVGAATASPEVGVVSPVHVDRAGTLDRLFGTYLSSSGIPAHRTRQASPFEVDFVNAAAWLLPRSVIERVGGFSPLFFHYGEDREYVDRLRHLGYRVRVVPTCVVVHDRGDRPQGWREDPTRQLRAIAPGMMVRLASVRHSRVGTVISAIDWLVRNVVEGFRAGQWRVLTVVAEAARTAATKWGAIGRHRRRVGTTMRLYVGEET